MRTTWNSYANPRLLFGPGALSETGKVVQRLGGQRVLIVTDAVIESLGIVSRVKELLTAKVEVFADGEVEPSTSLVEKCVERIRSFDPDVTIAIGGGSNMDLAKLAGASVASEKDPAGLLGFDLVTHSPRNLICIPTTAGTGSEASHSAVICNSNTGQKAAAISHYLRPDVAIVDPELSLTCPRKLTAESGIDALTHAIEGYLATDYAAFDPTETGVMAYEGNHPIGDLYAEKCIRLVGTHFLKAIDEPGNIEARTGMALAATLGGLAFSNCGVALVHALEYPIGNRYKCSHGAGNGIVLPEVMRFFAPARGERLADIGRWLGGEPSVEGAIHSVLQLRKEAGLPESLRAVGAESEDIPALAEAAAQLERLMDLCPIRPSVADLQDILEASF